MEDQGQDWSGVLGVGCEGPPHGVGVPGAPGSQGAAGEGGGRGPQGSWWVKQG